MIKNLKNLDHFDRISQIGAEAHVNTCYKHFIYFVTEFNLLNKQEIEPLVRIINTGIL